MFRRKKVPEPPSTALNPDLLKRLSTNHQNAVESAKAKYAEFNAARCTMNCPKCFSGNLKRLFIENHTMGWTETYQNISAPWAGGSWQIVVMPYVMPVLEVRCECGYLVRYERPADVAIRVSDNEIITNSKETNDK